MSSYKPLVATAVLRSPYFWLGFGFVVHNAVIAPRGHIVAFSIAAGALAFIVSGTCVVIERRRARTARRCGDDV